MKRGRGLSPAKFLPVFVVLFAVFFLGTAVAESATYTVKKGDNLHGIAKKLGLKVKDLQEANHIGRGTLRPGMKLVLPAEGKSSRKTARKGANAGRGLDAKNETIAPGEGGAATVQVSGDLYHTVKKGDTLSSVARKYSIPVAEVKELNGLKSSRLKRGQKLLVRKIGPKTYTVKKGDTLRTIAKRFDMEPDSLVEMNELGATELSVGRKLYLEQRVDPETAEKYVEILASKNVEEEIKEISQSEEFSEKGSQEKLVTFAKKLINIPYKFGGNSILGIDCSAYVRKVYGFLGVELPRTAREQFHEGEAVEKEELSIGDLVFFRTYASFPSHVGIYLGNNLFIHASSRGKKVTIDSLETPYYLKRFIGGKRLLTENDIEANEEHGG